VAHPVLRHRIITNFNAEAEGMTTDKLVADLIGSLPAPEGDPTDIPGVRAVLNDG
jgi:MoxR-like ATPase